VNLSRGKIFYSRRATSGAVVIAWDQRIGISWYVQQGPEEWHCPLIRCLRGRSQRGIASISVHLFGRKRRLGRHNRSIRQQYVSSTSDHTTPAMHVGPLVEVVSSPQGSLRQHLLLVSIEICCGKRTREAILGRTGVMQPRVAVAMGACTYHNGPTAASALK
jgi:hypothetical protein